MLCKHVNLALYGAGTIKAVPDRMKGALARLKPSLMGGSRDKAAKSPTAALTASVNSPFSRPPSGMSKGGLSPAMCCT